MRPVGECAFAGGVTRTSDGHQGERLIGKLTLGCEGADDSGNCRKLGIKLLFWIHDVVDRPASQPRLLSEPELVRSHQVGSENLSKSVEIARPDTIEQGLTDEL